MTRRIALVLGAAALAVAGIWWLRDPVARLAERTVPEGGLLQVRIGRAVPDATVRIPGPGPELEAALYRPDAAASAAVLLVHGNRREGGRAPLYRLLARSLARRGVWTAVLTLRGFGGSDPAPSTGPVTAADLRADVERGLGWLETAAPPGIPRGVVGHSLGALLALDLCGTPGVAAVVLEPGKDIAARVVRPPAPELDAFTRKLAENLRGATITGESVRALYGDLDPEAPAGPVPAGSCTIVHGERVTGAERASLRRMVAARPGTALRWVDTRDHFLGTTVLGRFDAWSARSLAKWTEVIVSCLVSRPGLGGEARGTEPAR